MADDADGSKGMGETDYYRTVEDELGLLPGSAPCEIRCDKHKMYPGNFLAFARPSWFVNTGTYGIALEVARHVSKRRARRDRLESRWLVRRRTLTPDTPLNELLTFRCAHDGHDVEISVGDLASEIQRLHSRFDRRMFI